VLTAGVIQKKVEKKREKKKKDTTALYNSGEVEKVRGI